MPVMNQEKFLAHIANRLARPRRTRIERPDWSVTPQHELYKDFNEEQLIAMFEKQCQAIHTTFKRTNRSHLLEVLRETISEYKGKTIITANDPRNEAYGLTKLFQDLQDDVETYIWDERKGCENKKMAERADIGINFSDITIAETATVTLFHNKHNGRSISILPKYFIAIIPKETIVPRMTQAVQIIREKIAQEEAIPAYISFNSGPSNSADIEMKLIVGVHGPIKATYILVE